MARHHLNPAGRKRSGSNGSANPDDKRQKNGEQDSGYQSQQVSPKKVVQFDRQLEQGPTRPSLQRHDDNHEVLSPSTQLQNENDAANQPSTCAWSPSWRKDLHQQMSTYVTPPLPLNVEEVCAALDIVKNLVAGFSRSVPATRYDSLKDNNARLEILDDLLHNQSNAYLIKTIGSIAQGGNDHVSGWAELFARHECRKSLVAGIVGRALKDHVFSKLYFGASKAFDEELAALEIDQVHRDGFFRTKYRQSEINKYKNAGDRETFHLAVARLTLELEKMLLPLWELGSKSKSKARTARWSDEDRQNLAEIIMVAANLSRSIRRTGDVVYYWTHTFKDEEFDPGRMECLNLTDMIKKSPYKKENIDGHERAILDKTRANESEAIVQIVCFPGLVAYRRGGGKLAQRVLDEEEKATRRKEEKATRREEKRLPEDVKAQRKRFAARDQQLTGNEGFRTKMISKYVVHLEWGKQHLLTKEAGTSRHMDAMQGRNGRSMALYEKDFEDCVELWNVYQEMIKDHKKTALGVYQWHENNKKGESSPGIFSRLLGG
ncbi:uncharacterized protein LTR77_004279 [Saxophila tyrrhenica]|uniref:Uncharacterized protein n=1 Tax=Saxophila tyrrhenica TaxID=1690608 RepID=A0AAV9PD14_9PEZI|nr:hypothetical protein LTR77_004279 [Saxophila tyrrhenica]